MKPCPVIESLLDKHISRYVDGCRKFGRNISDRDEPLSRRLKEIQEELMDAAVYIEWAIQEIERTGV